MPSKAGPSLPSMNSASTARNAAHPYAHAQANGRPSKKTTSVAEEKPQLSPTSAVSPSDTIATTPTRSNKKKPTNGQNSTKSNRQQFSACHACRYRRVKCDLKDLGEAQDPAVEISCTNCLERGIRCKDDYAESKKQLRRGKRINQLELEDNLMDQGDDAPFTPIRPRTTTIPALKPEFFDSPFYRRFYIQRPIIDPVEFRSRYVAWLQHQLTPDSNAALSSATTPLSVEGQLLAKILVVWAAAYGVDEAGTEQPENSVQDVQKRRIRVKGLLEEVIRLIDSLSLLRKPSWDGVRCLLLTLPLTEDALDNPMDRLAMYEAAIQQVYTLCQHDGITTGLSPETRAANAMVRARIFWYAHVHEGLTTGLRGGRLLMDDDDLTLFQRELPPAPTSFNPKALQTTNMTYSLAFQYATAPIRLASACRKVHAALTGPKARASKRLDGKKLEDTWESLALCWEEFESLRSIQRSDHVTNEDNTRFVDGWQIFLFECYNVIQEKIRDRLDTAQAARISEYESSPDSPATVEGLIRDLNKYLAIAESKCFDLLDHVLHLIKRHLGSSFFAYDASLVRDGCFFAGHTLALMPGRDEDVRVCLQALSEMRWAFSKGNERSQSIRLAWRSQSDYQGQPVHSSPEVSPSNGDDRNSTDPTPRPDLSNNAPPPSQQKRSRATPPTHPLPGAIQQQQLHVSSLPSHSAPRMPAHTASHSTSVRDPLPLNQHRHPPQNGSMQRQDVGAASTSFVDHGIDQKLPTNWSPVHPQPPRGVSAHSSSSDGSSPPEIGVQPMLHYSMPSKPPSSYDAVPRGYPHPSMDPGIFAQSPTHRNGHTHGYPPVNGHSGNVGPVHGRLPNQQHYHPPSFHPGPPHYQTGMAPNGMGMNNFAFPMRQQTHAPPFGANATVSPDEIGGYPSRGEYFSLSPEVNYPTGVPVPNDGSQYLATAYAGNSHHLYYGPP